MPMGPENRLINAIKKELGSDVYSEKMHNAYRGGTPDVWYSGRGGDLWVEWKWAASIPKSGVIVPNLSELQKQWLRRRNDEGRRVAVVVGTPRGCALFLTPEEWEAGATFEDEE